jgi:hypothetical protein
MIKKTPAATTHKSNAESGRLLDPGHAAAWKTWGPYLSERQWGTVREDYSPGGTAWEYFPHDHARSRAYRWGEDGIGGISDDGQRLCLALALWNGQDPALKERLFGLTNQQGNHGEDVKELYYYLDATPTHSYLKMLYKYPQREFPYARLIDENARRGADQREFELIDTGIFDDDRYFDVFIEYAKAAPDDILMRVTVHNRGPETARIHLLPQLWFRNTWSWKAGAPRPKLSVGPGCSIAAAHADLGQYQLCCDGAPEFLFCDNDTNVRRLFGTQDATGFFKDAFHEYVVNGNHAAVNPAHEGTKAAAWYDVDVPAGGSRQVRLRLVGQTFSRPGGTGSGDFPVARRNTGQESPVNRSRPGGRKPALHAFRDFDDIFDRRRREADEFYGDLQQYLADDDARNIQRQAFAGMIWGKQLYYYDVPEWLDGDPAQPPPPPERKQGRNHDWRHLNNYDVLSMPDKWEFPWYAAWDLAFHCVPLALIDADFAKNQLVLLTREWFMHPNGQLPAYEWAFDDVNPPVHAWAAWRVFQIDRKQRRERSGNAAEPGDLLFLERVFHKLLLNFTWWVNRKDPDGRNIFQGGFLGLDNIGVFDRSKPLPTGGYINQADGTSWMAMYSLNLMRIALSLARHDKAYEDIATKFFEHFLYIAQAMNNIGDEGIGLWDEQDEFYYDVLNLPDGRKVPLKARSMVGLIPLFAVETLEPQMLKDLPEFAARLEWFLANRPELASLVSRWNEPGVGERRMLSLLRGHRMKCLLRRMLDETEFLSDHGVRALSKAHEREPYCFRTDGQSLEVSYWPGESQGGIFGGNSNWRGPIWMPMNFLIIEALQKFHHYYGDDFRIEYPVHSGKSVTILEVANELSRRLSRIFLRDQNGRRAVFGDNTKFQNDPHFRDYILFHEYFHGDNGRGCGASHQTGWTGLIAKILQPRMPEGKKSAPKAPIEEALD